jgi:hypothetical protein
MLVRGRRDSGAQFVQGAPEHGITGAFDDALCGCRPQVDDGEESVEQGLH